jgi:hypothetical protein
MQKEDGVMSVEELRATQTSANAVGEGIQQLRSEERAVERLPASGCPLENTNVTNEGDERASPSTDEHTLPGERTKDPKRSTSRVQLHRDRCRRGLTPLTIELYGEEIDDLIRHGFLGADQREDRAELAKGLGQVLDRAFRVLRDGSLPKG